MSADRDYAIYSSVEYKELSLVWTGSRFSENQGYIKNHNFQFYLLIRENEV